MTSEQYTMNLYRFLGMQNNEPSLPKTVYDRWCTKIVTITEFPAPRLSRQGNVWILEAWWYPEFGTTDEFSAKTYFADTVFFEKNNVYGFVVPEIENCWTVEDAYNLITKRLARTQTDKLKEQS